MVQMRVPFFKRPRKQPKFAKHPHRGDPPSPESKLSLYIRRAQIGGHVQSSKAQPNWRTIRFYSCGQNRHGPRSLSATPNGPWTSLAIHRPGDAARRLWPIQDPARRAFRPVPPWDSAGSAPRHEILRSVNILCRLRHDATMARWLARCGPATVCVPTQYAMRCLLAARPVIRAPVLLLPTQ